MPKRNLIWIVAIIAATLVTLWVTRRRPPQAGRREPGEFDPVSQTYRLIQDEYYRPIDAPELRQGAVNGMVSVLDEHSTYISPEKLRVFQDRMRGIERGLGLRLAAADGNISVERSLANSPAHKAGIIPGDIILAIDGEEIAAKDIQEVEEMLKGELGTTVELAILRTKPPPKKFSLTRSEFALESIEGLYRDSDGRWVYLIEGQRGLGYVRIKEFVDDTCVELQEILRELGSLSALVLDLRDNPGGKLPVAAETGNLFLREGVIVTSLGRSGDAKRYTARSDGTLSPEFPMVVLIDHETASAAEIVCGALRLHSRAVLVGTRTRGKGRIQSMLGLPDDLGQINLTTSELLIGTDRPIMREPNSDTWGVDPHADQEVVIPPADRERLRSLRARAGGLLAPANDSPASVSAAARRTRKALATELVSLDAQLSHAVELLTHPEEVTKILARPSAAQTAPLPPATQDAEDLGE